MPSTLKITNMSLADRTPETTTDCPADEVCKSTQHQHNPDHDPNHHSNSNSNNNSNNNPCSDDKSAYSAATGANSTATGLSTAAMSDQSSLDPMFDDAALCPFDVLLYPPHNPFSDPEEQVLQFASETHPGNVRFLVLLDLHRPFYRDALRHSDKVEADRILDEIVSQVLDGCVPPGTFREWIVDEQDLDDYGDLGDDTGVYGQDGGWEDRNADARMLVLRGLVNAPVTSEFDTVQRRESIDIDMLCAVSVAASDEKNADEAAAVVPDASPVKERKDNNKTTGKKRSSKMSLKKMFGKKSSKANSTLEDNTSSDHASSMRSSAISGRSSLSKTLSAKDIANTAASTPSTDPNERKVSAGMKRTRKMRTASDSESITAFIASQKQRRRLSGLPSNPEQPIPKSDLTRSDVLLHSETSKANDVNNTNTNTTNDKDDDDRILGLSKANKHRSGNRRCTYIIEMYKASFDAVQSDPAKCAALVAEIAATMYRGTGEPGRFLKEDPATGMYREVSCERAMKTIEHLLETARPPTSS